MGSRRHTFVGALCGAVLVAAAGAGYMLSRPADGARPAAAAPSVSRPTRAPAIMTPSAPTPSVTPTPSVAPSRPRTRHEPVRPAAPTAFTLTGPRFTIHAHVCAMADVRPYDPPGEQEHTVCWVRSGFGSKPGSSAATSYIFGHSWAEDAREVLNRASAPATREVLRAHPVRLDGVPVYPVHVLDGYQVVLRTRTGTLDYVVRRAYGVRKMLLGGIASWENDTIRNRVVITTCAERGGVDYDYNIVVEAYLRSAVTR